MSKQFFWLKILSTNTLDTNVHKLYECDKKPSAILQCKKVSKNEIYGKFGPLIEHGPH
jgi:hypothetical protein